MPWLAGMQCTMNMHGRCKALTQNTQACSAAPHLSSPCQWRMHAVTWYHSAADPLTCLDPHSAEPEEHYRLTQLTHLEEEEGSGTRASF